MSIKQLFHYELHGLENDLVALQVFDPAKHAARFVALVQAHPEAFTYVAFPVLDSVDAFMSQVYEPIAASPADALFAIVDKTRPCADDLAGVLSLIDTSKTDASTEIGVVVFPAFQRTHVASNAIGLALTWLLDPPSRGGLGLRRVLWQANAANKASRRVALRMGFELEGILRWRKAIEPNRPCQAKGGVSAAALATRNGTPPDKEALGRHTAVFSLVWDEWDAKRPTVLAQMTKR